MGAGCLYNMLIMVLCENYLCILSKVCIFAAEMVLNTKNHPDNISAIWHLDVVIVMLLLYYL